MDYESIIALTLGAITDDQHLGLFNGQRGDRAIED